MTDYVRELDTIRDDDGCGVTVGVDHGRGTARRSGTQAIDRAAGLLAEVVRADEPVTCADLCRASGLPRSTASRLMQALERNKLVRRDRSGGYVPGEMFDIYAQEAWLDGI